MPKNGPKNKNLILRSVIGFIELTKTQKKVQLNRRFSSRVIVVSDIARKTLRKKPRIQALGIQAVQYMNPQRIYL